MIVLDFDELWVLFQQAESVERLLRNTRPQILSMDMCSLHLSDLRVRQLLERIGHVLGHGGFVKDAILVWLFPLSLVEGH